MEARSVTTLSEVTPTGSQIQVITPDELREIPNQVVNSLDCLNKHKYICLKQKQKIYVRKSKMWIACLK